MVFGNRAKQFASGMVFVKIVEVVPSVKDRYQRIVGMVYFNGSCLNEELIKNGFAWVYRQYCANKPLCDKWLSLEAEANKKHIDFGVCLSALTECRYPQSISKFRKECAQNPASIHRS
jgi:endonuclease YncB( thermonuclease family)